MHDDVRAHAADERAHSRRIGGSTAEDVGWGKGTGQRVEVDTEYWDSLMAFVDKTGFQLVWDLNAMKMRYVGSATKQWNSSNAEVCCTCVHVCVNMRVLGIVHAQCGLDTHARARTQALLRYVAARP